ncbi:hypothetical protein [Allocoleopsis franciscana]|uniref:Uncharacterized protein n=1 Tax=Allocoleopsis franciscana PCC 7113 TaxID=1173027 RepID=K9WAU5_9CYAN|nr:hypothetical protein [Allocoleopsis franciscana]AFZ17358.1 hypothetical protein Mic7113_1482 [Allocoleopsis franciscana PCC 7113]
MKSPQEKTNSKDEILRMKHEIIPRLVKEISPSTQANASHLGNKLNRKSSRRKRRLHPSELTLQTFPNRIAFYVLLSKGWFPSLSLGLLTTLLGTIGLIPTAKADELPEPPNLGLGKDEVLTTDVSLNHGLKTDIASVSVYRLTHFHQSLKDEPLNLTNEALNPSSFDKFSGDNQKIHTLTDLLKGEGEEVPQTVEIVPKNASVQSSVLRSLNIDSTAIDAPRQADSLLPRSKDSVSRSEILQRQELEVREQSQPNTDTSEAFAPQTPTEGQLENLGESARKQPILALTNDPNRVRILSPSLALKQNDAPATEAAALAPGTVRILTPQSGVTDKTSTNLVIQYNANDSVQVSVNQKPLDPKTATQQNRDEAQNLINQAWYNIPLKEGDNTLTVQAGNGTPVSIQVVVQKTALKLEIAPVGDPRVAADGRSTLTVSGRITDENGQLLSEDAVVTLTAAAGQFVGADQDKDQPGFQVMARGGQFTAQLQSSLEAQKVRIRAALEPKEEKQTGRPGEIGNAPAHYSESSSLPLSAASPPAVAQTPLEAYTQVEFVTNLRPSLVSGVINLRIGPSGTNFWGRRRDFLNPETIDDGTEFDLQGAVFATGRIGEWLFTGAYNSSRNLNETCDGITRLFRGPQFCEQQYPVTGDSSTVDYLTPSIDSVYLRFERNAGLGKEPDYVMWGDYNSNEFARESQLFTATTRQLHGFKGNYNFGNLQLTAMFSRNLQGFQRDTIAPNGTSGYYFVSRRRLVPGSENIFIETEEANRPGTVISRKPLGRGSDYEIDYDRGTILFRRPILATEFAFFDAPLSEAGAGSTLLVRKIVVTYQYEGGVESDDTNLYAGRVQYNFSQAFQQESWLAGTYLRQEQGIQDFELYGADFRVALGTNGQIIGEVAHSEHDSLFRGNVSGSAYRLEANATIVPGLLGRAYYRSVEENFSNDATLSFTPGQTRYGAAIAYSIGSSTTLRAGYDYEENFGVSPLIRTDFFDLFNPGVAVPPGTGVNNSLRTISAGVQQKIGNAALSVDFVNREREDRVGNVFTGNASQLVSRLGLPISESLTFLAQNELSLGDNDPLYPNRTTLGMDWRAYKGVTLRLAHQFFDGGILGNDSITSLDTILSHNIWDNTTITGRYSVISGFNGVTGQGAVGLNHRWTVSPGLLVNLGYEHTFSNTGIATAAGVRFAQPYTVGQTAASLALLGGDVFNIGVEYTDNPDFKASARVEHRTGSGNNNTVFSIAGAGKLSPSLTLLARYEQANFANQLIEGLKDTANLRVGLAYRDPNSDRWNALMRYEYRKNPSTIPETLLFGSGTGSTEHLFAGEAIFAPSWRWEFYGKGAVRYSNTDLANNFSNASTIFLTQLRAAYRLNYRMDLAVEGRWIGQDSPGYSETGIAVETGYYVTPDLRLALGYSFGGVDDRDFTGYRSKGGVYFNLTFKVNELFGGFGRQKVVPPQQQESLTKPVANQPTSDTPGTQSSRPSNTTSEE